MNWVDKQKALHAGLRRATRRETYWEAVNRDVCRTLARGVYRSASRCLDLVKVLHRAAHLNIGLATGRADELD